MATDPVVEMRTEHWVAVPGEGLSGTRADVELRPGSDERKVRIKSTSLYDTEVEIEKLRDGLDRIEQEHRR